MKFFAKLSKMIEESPNRRDLEKTIMGITEERSLADDKENEIKEKTEKAFKIVESFNQRRNEEKEDAGEDNRLNTSKDSYER